MDLSPLSPTRQVSRRQRQRQRACDFCRSRKSACLTENGLPCRLCQTRRRTCTFNYTPGNASAQRVFPNSPGPVGVSGFYQQTPVGQPVEPNTGRGSEPEFAVQSPQETSTWDSSGGMDVALMARELEQRAGPGPASGDLQQQDLGLFLLDELTDDLLVFPPEIGGRDLLAHDEGEPSPQSNGARAGSLPAVGAGMLHSEGSVWEFADFTTDMDPYLMRYHPFDASRTWTSKRISIRSVQDGPVPINFLLRSEPSPENASAQTALEELVPAGIGQRLISLYFRFIFCQLPIFSLKSRPSAFDAPPHLLAAIYLITLPFADFDDHLAIQIIYDAPTIKSLREVAQRGVAAGRGHPNTALIQTALLLGLAPPQSILYPEVQERWAFIGDAVLMCHSLGLLYDPSQWSVSLEEIRLRRRLAWTVRYADTWIAAAAGRQPLITSSNFMLDLPTLSDFLERETEDDQDGEDATDDVMGFIYLSRLTSILVKILERLYSVQSVHQLGVDLKLSLQTCRPLMDELSRWHQELPTNWPSDETAAIDLWGFLHLGWHFSKLLVYRALFRPFHNVEYDFLALSSDEKEGALDHLRAGARGSSIAFANFTAQLSNRSFCAFWPFWSVGAWAAMVNMWVTLLITARTEEEGRTCKASLDHVRQVLRLQSRSFGILRLALLRLDSIYWKGFPNMFRLTPHVNRVIREGVENQPLR